MTYALQSNFIKNIKFILLSFLAIDLDASFKIKYILIPLQCLFLAYSFPHYDILKKNIFYVPYAILPIYFLYLFLCFSKNGFKNFLIKKFGEINAYEINRTSLNFIFFWYGCALASVSYFNPGNFNQSIDIYFKVAGIILFIIGVILRHSAVFNAGYDAYYAKDLFFERHISNFTAKGVYKYFKNPMYGIGYMHAYGLAIFYESVPGLIATIICQCFLFIFFYSIEFRHIKENIINKNNVVSN